MDALTISSYCACRLYCLLWLWWTSSLPRSCFAIAYTELSFDSPSPAPNFSSYAHEHYTHHHHHHRRHRQDADAAAAGPSLFPSTSPSPAAPLGDTITGPAPRLSALTPPEGGAIAELSPSSSAAVDGTTGSPSPSSPDATSSKSLPAIATTPSPAPAAAPLSPPALLNSSIRAPPLEPAQLEALRLLGIHVGSQPCTSASMRDTLLCDKGSPERHVIALHMELCGRDTVMREEAMAKLANSLKALSFVDCPMLPGRMPAQLLRSLVSLTCVASLGATSESSEADMPVLPIAWLSKFRNLSELAVADVHVNGSGVGVLTARMKHIKHLRISNTNLTGILPLTYWPPNLTSIDLSFNAISGPFPPSLTNLSLLVELDLSHNRLSGFVPDTFHKLKKLQKLALASNSLFGPFPSSLSNLSSSLIYLDLSSNTLNGPIPQSLNNMKSLRYLDLSHNHFTGQLPFNQTFLDKLNTLKVRGNLGICYDHSMLNSPFLEGVPPCDSSGLPIVPSTLSPSQAPQNAFAPSEPQLFGGPPTHNSRGPRIIIAAIVITLVVIIVFIIVVVLVSRCRGNKV